MRAFAGTPGHNRRVLPVLQDQGIDDFPAHQAPPPRHPNLPAGTKIYKMINNHGSLTSRAFHQPTLLLLSVGYSIGAFRQDLKNGIRNPKPFHPYPHPSCLLVITFDFPE